MWLMVGKKTGPGGGASHPPLERSIFFKAVIREWDRQHPSRTVKKVGVYGQRQLQESTPDQEKKAQDSR